MPKLDNVIKRMINKSSTPVEDKDGLDLIDKLFE